MKRFKVGAVVVLAGLLAAGSASAAVYTLDYLMTGNQGGDVGVTVGDKIFTDWGFGAAGNAPLTAAEVGVDITGSGSDYYVSFSGGFQAFNGAIYDYQLYYSVATVSGAKLIGAIDQEFVLTAAGEGGIVAIGEKVKNAAGATVAQSSVSFDYGVGDYEDPAGETLQGDQLIINPLENKVWVEKDILLMSDGRGSGVAVTILTQSFHQVPDGGATLSLLGLALAGVAMVRRLIA